MGQTLTADVSRISDHADSTFYYSWIRNDGTADTDIDGATNSTYTLTANDDGKTIKVRVISWDYWDYGVDLFSRTSAATVAVAAKPNTAPTGLPTINGTPQVGETLTADTSNIADDDGLDNVSYSYQWIRVDNGANTDIAGATDSTYTLTSSDQGKTIKVRVSFTDDAGNEESLTSAATATIAARPQNSEEQDAESGPAAAIVLSPPTSPVGTTIDATMTFSNLESDSETSTKDYIFRADVRNSEDADADQCEDRDDGYGLGVDRYMYKVDEDPEVRTGTISANCPAGAYTLRASISSPDGVELASASAGFSIVNVGPPLSNDATLSGLSLSGVGIGTFDSAATTYTASVGNDVTQTTVTPTVNDDDATYIIKLGGAADTDGVIPLAVGSNVITVEVTAENAITTKTYTVTVTRAAPPLSDDATLSGLTLSGIDFGTFDPATTGYSVSVANDVAQTTVTPTLNDDGASYAIKLDGVADGDRVISLAVGSNVITIEVTAENGITTKIYTVTVTRAAPGPTVAVALSPSGSVEPGTEITVTMSFANLEADSDTSDTDYIFRADVRNSDGEAANQCENRDGGYGLGVERYMYKVDEDPEVRKGTISADCPAGDYTVRVSVSSADNVELASASANFTVNAPEAQQQTSEPQLSTDATLSGLTLSGVDIGTFDPATTGYAVSVGNDVAETAVTPTVNDGGATFAIKLDGIADSDGTVSLAVGSNVITVVVTAEDGQTTKTYTVTVTRPEPPASDDATLSGLALSGIDIGTFDSATIEYSASVGNEVAQTTVTVTVNDDGATYAIKLNGIADSDGTVSLAVGSNVITVVVTAEDGQTTKTYTGTVTRAAPPSNDATLSALTLSGIDIGTFDPTTTAYTASVDNDVTETTVTATTSDDGAAYAVKLDGVEDADGTVTLAVGENFITVEVTAEDGQTTKTYTVTVTRAEPPSTDATLSGLALSGIDIGTLDSATVTYTASVGNDVAQTTVTATVNDGGATYAVKLGGTEDADGTVDLAVGANVITVVVTAEDGQTTKTYTVTVTRAEPPSTDATLSGLALSAIDIGTFDSATVTYTASVGNDVTATTVTATVNDSEANYVVKLDGTEDADGKVDLAVGSNAITVEVTAEDGQTTKTYTVTVTRAAPPASDDATLSALSLSGIDFGTFDPATTTYTASVGNDMTATTVTATVNDSEASYVVKLDGAEDADGTVDLAVGSNAIAVEVTAEDGQTTKTYTVTVTRAAPPASDDATLSSLSLSGIDIGTFDPATTTYTASVGNEMEQTTVTPTVNDDGASYVVKLDGAEDADGTVDLAVGDNAIAVEVTAEDGQTTKTYTITVTRAEPSSDPPATPTGLSGEETSQRVVSLDWDDAAGATSYQVGLWDSDAAAWVVLPTDDTSIVMNGSGATVSGLPDFGGYYFRVRSVNSAGSSEWSGHVYVRRTFL